MHKLLVIALLGLSLTACQSTLDKKAARQNDVNVQMISDDNAALMDVAKVSPATRAGMEANALAAVRVARKMAISAGNEDLPEIK